jgi:ankyrin repeat protein
LPALIRSGINIDTEESTNAEKIGFTALHVAAYHGLYTGIPQLLEAGANINKPVGVLNKKFAGLTALQLGIIRDLPMIVHTLLENHASIEPKDVTLLCFRSFLDDLSPQLPIRNPVELEIIQKEIANIAKDLVFAGFEFGEEIKFYVMQNFGINLSALT